MLCDGVSKDSSDDEDFIKPASKPSLYPVSLKGRVLVQEGEKALQQPRQHLQLGTIAFWSTALPAAARFPSMQLRNMQIDVLSL